MADVGRPERPNTQVYTDTVPDGSSLQAVLVKQDEIIATLKALTAKLDVDSGVADTNYAALLTNALKVVKLI